MLIGAPEKDQHRHTGGPGTAGSYSCSTLPRKVYPYDYQILPCFDCLRCKKDDFICAIKDGISETYPELKEANLIVYGTH